MLLSVAGQFAVHLRTTISGFQLGQSAAATASEPPPEADALAESGAAAPDGFAAIFDANGVATLAQSYAHLARTGKLVVYGFTTNLPSGAMLNPLAWVKMARDLVRLPRFDPMDLVLASKSVHGFNLSFFADETALVDAYMDQLVRWVGEGRLTVAKVTEFDASAVPRAHQLIQSGKSVGKIVCRTKEQQG